MILMVPEITNNSTICLTGCSDQNQGKHHSPVLLGPVWGESIGDRWIPLTKGQ